MVEVYIACKAWVRHGDKYLVLINSNGWDLPGGRCTCEEFSEMNFTGALKRELFEETGIEAHEEPRIIGISSWVRTPRRDEDDVEKKILCLHYSVDANHVLRDSIKLSAEHDKYRWRNKKSIKKHLPGGLIPKRLWTAYWRAR